MQASCAALLCECYHDAVYMRDSYESITTDVRLCAASASSIAVIRSGKCRSMITIGYVRHVIGPQLIKDARSLFSFTGACSIQVPFYGRSKMHVVIRLAC